MLSHIDFIPLLIVQMLLGKLLLTGDQLLLSLSLLVLEDNLLFQLIQRVLKMKQLLLGLE